MAKEIKDFELWQPPPPPDDEPLFEDEPLWEWLPAWMQRRRERLTSTGAVWAFLPFYFLIKKKLSFSMLEFVIWIAAWGGSVGSITSKLMQSTCPWLAIGIVLYVVSHLHCLMFTSALYHSRLRGPHFNRLLNVIVPQLLLFSFCTFIVIAANHR